MKPYLTTVFGTIDSYELWIHLGSVCIAVLFFILAVKYYHSRIYVAAVMLYSFLLIQMGGFVSNFLKGIAGADWSERNLLWQYMFQSNGSHFIGRVLFVSLVFPVGYRLIFVRHRNDWEKSFDILCIAMTVQHMFNRMACLMHGCCRGRYYNGIFALTFPIQDSANEAYSYPVYPTQPFEIGCMLILLLLLVSLYRKEKRLYPFFLLGFALTIFVSEFMMSTEGVLLIFGLSIFQYAALVLAGVSVYHFLRCSR